ncbi:MAG: hypothetical protein WBD86_02890 [Microgenomates group bacterium]
MTYFIERGKGGPSKLDERLEAFRHPETGNIILTKEQAVRIGFESLLALYRESVTEGIPPFNYPSPKIEALAQIVNGELGERYDFTDIVESIKEEQRKRETEKKEERKISSIITSPEPPQAEI